MKVLDALKNPDHGYYDPRDIFTTVPRSSLPSEPYTRAVTEGRPGALKGMRIGIIREFMVKHAKVDEPIVEAAATEMKAMLGGHLGATLVESVTRGWWTIPTSRTCRQRSIARSRSWRRVLYPDLLLRLTAANEPFYPTSRSKVKPTEFGPGVTRGTGAMAAADWMLRWAEGLEPSPRNLTLRSVLAGGEAQSRTFRFHIPQYLSRRAKDWADRGHKETLVDWPSLNARSKFWGDDQRAAFKNWEEIDNLYEPPKGIADNMQRREFLQRVMMKFLQDNRLDLLIQLHTALPPGKIGWLRSQREQPRDLVPARPERWRHRDSDPGRLRQGRIDPCSSSPPMPTAGGSTRPHRNDADRSAGARHPVLVIFWWSRDGAPGAESGLAYQSALEAPCAATCLPASSARAVGVKNSQLPTPTPNSQAQIQNPFPKSGSHLMETRAC